MFVQSDPRYSHINIRLLDEKVDFEGEEQEEVEKKCEKVENLD